MAVFYAAFGVVAFYWVVRLAVAGGIRDARKSRQD